MRTHMDKSISVQSMVAHRDVDAPTFSRLSVHKLRRGCQPYALAGRPLHHRKIPSTYFC
jgi:hypothetical protein